MKQDLSESLGNLHNQHRLYINSDFLREEEKNIIYHLDDFNYLKKFYLKYRTFITNNEENYLNNKKARNLDLPFLGQKVIESGKADFIFYFEGSLSSNDKLSITVLAHLWLTQNDEIINKFCGEGKWWTNSHYRNIQEKFNIKTSVTERSYIADSKRFESNERCSKLIHDEIKLLEPKIVICVGNTAKDLTGMNYFDLPTKFHYVKFPKYHNDNEIYNSLRKILDKL
ncbi:hypothetical protein C3K47_16275 [Solitalea longa]|uniref:Uracil-DNA glycosylase-like domain-containing protein n=1 Tax=Solitalea longa TaxID=2079460 RepID=A0A2S4ZXP7_9SPHI|nr:hypothetical protein [Solitalea longa]POY35138.1 hypothetical protein C3K47_16275 [Solitalea longa]